MACPVKKDLEQNMYSRPALDFPEDDEDLDNLPEAGEIEGENEDESNKDTASEDSS